MGWYLTHATTIWRKKLHYRYNMEKINIEIKKGTAPIHLKSLVKKEKAKFLIKTRASKIFNTNGLQLDIFYKSPL